MIEVKVALASVLSRQLKLQTKRIPLENSLSRVLAEDIFADMDQPPFHRVAMDGIAIQKTNLKTTKKFKILGTVGAGKEITPLPDGEVCFEVMTGAVLPTNADLVIRYEDLRISEGYAEVVADVNSLNSNFHPQGTDYRQGDKVLSLGTLIKSTTTAILASVGKTQVHVYDMARIAILSTGDELVEIGATPRPHQIRWSNGISLKQELASHGITDVTLYRVNDNESAIKNLIQDLLVTKDLLLFTGGVSAGKYDFVPKVLKECKVAEIFHKVAQRPGKPLWFGKSESDVFVFGLPGNPVSCLINLRKYVIPFLQNSVPGNHQIRVKAFLAEDVKFNKNMTYYCPIKLKNDEGKMVAIPQSGNGSGDFFQLRDSDGFIELAPSDAPFKAGFLGEVYLWGKIE